MKKLMILIMTVFVSTTLIACIGMGRASYNQGPCVSESYNSCDTESKYEITKKFQYNNIRRVY